MKVVRRPTKGQLLRAADVPVGQVVLTAATRRCGVVIDQSREATTVEFDRGERRLHPEIILEIT